MKDYINIIIIIIITSSVSLCVLKYDKWSSADAEMPVRRTDGPRMDKCVERLA